MEVIKICGHTCYSSCVIFPMPLCPECPSPFKDYKENTIYFYYTRYLHSVSVLKIMLHLINVVETLLSGISERSCDSL